MVFILFRVCCCGMAVVCAATSLHCPVCVVRALPIPVQYSLVLRSCRVLFSVRSVMCAGKCVSVLFVWWGVLHLCPPRIGGGWGHRGWWGGMTRWGGMVGEGRVLSY